MILNQLENILIGITGEDPDLRSHEFDLQKRLVGGDWPASACSMIGKERMHQVRTSVEALIKAGIPGDLIETGVWRGGACILMRAILKEFGITDRKVYVADSFKGLPKPDGRFEADMHDKHHLEKALAISVAEVKENFSAYNLLDEQVVFLEGWFKDTLPTVPGPFALIRLDGDMYGSTMDALDNLYDKLSFGGIVTIDDFGAIAQCQLAVTDFRRKRGINCPIQKIDWTGIYWVKE